MLALLLLLTAPTTTPAHDAATSAATGAIQARARSTSDAYLWQRTGNAAAVASFGALSSGRLHVLAHDDAVGAGAGAFRRSDDDVMRALRATRVPVVATVRLRAIDDDVAGGAAGAGANAVRAALARFAGTDLRAVEVDFDCGVARLPAYAAWLRALRPTLTTPLGITALPAWLDDAAHHAVFAAADEVTLQVHAVQAGDHGLVDVDAALAAVARVQRDHPGTRIALPTYAITLNDGRQLHANVDDVARVRAVARLVSWFRWPDSAEPDERTAWSLPALALVDGGAASRSRNTVTLHRAIAPDGAVVVRLRAGGTRDAAVDVAVPCVALDGAVAFDAGAGFVVDGCALCPAPARFLRPGDDVVVGWARAASGPDSGELHASLVDPGAAVGHRHACRR